jgi:NCAIR mutase (PurE)-related protein
MKQRKVQSFDEVDVELEEAVKRLRDRVGKMADGRVIVVVERKRRVTIGHSVQVDGMLTEEIERVMTEKPRKEVQRCR